jgi:large subunit ribosomal protein L4
MPVVDVINLEGQTVGQVELSDAVFAAEVNPHTLYEAVRWQQAGERQGTHKTKVRSEVRGSGKKLWKQKGTGRARMGSVRSPIWRHGGTVHGPQPRDYSYNLPRKVQLGALRSALSAKLAADKMTVVEGWTIDSHKTKAFRLAVAKLDKGSRHTLVIEPKGNRNLELAGRNLANFALVEPRALRVFDLLRCDRMFVSRETALRLSASLEPKARAARAGKE